MKAKIFFLVISTALLSSFYPSNSSRYTFKIATYNIKWLGQADHNYELLAKVISEFDLCGIVEVKDENDLKELVKEIEKLTRDDWGYIYGHRTHRPNGSYHEAYAFVWNREKVQLGDGLISNVWDRDEKFRNDPYLASFRLGEFDFIYMLVHTRWSDDEDGTRSQEVEEFANRINFMSSFLDEDDIILAGDFNYSGEAAEMKEMAESSELVQLDSNPKTTFKRDYSDYASAYDHIYVSSSFKEDCEVLSVEALDATELIYGNRSRESMKKSKNELSDHLPVFMTINVSDTEDND